VIEITEKGRCGNQLRTAAAITAGLDLKLALVEEDLGRDTAMEVASQIVMFFNGPGPDAVWPQGRIAAGGRSVLQQVQRFVAAHSASRHSVKLPKLAAWKRGDNARTILVLEENDLSLTNHQRVADALVLAEAGLDDLSDEVFLVSSYVADLWWVTRLRRPGKTYYDDGERFHEVNPATLTQLTRR
jgi:hypothetical protein